MKVISSSFIYENPLPQLRSRQSAFPFACELSNGEIAAVTAIGQAFESVDSSSYLHISSDGGVTWSEPTPIFREGDLPFVHTPYGKPTCLPDGRLLVFGYSYLRPDEELPIGNPKTGGLLDDFLFYRISEDNGKTWGETVEVSCSWGRHAEASAPITVLKNGSWVSPITGFPTWDGKMTGSYCGRLIRSDDEGKTWYDDAVCMSFGSKSVTCYEQRLCCLDSGVLVCIGWNEDLETGKCLENHFTYSLDDGHTWSDPLPTGVMGQASSVCALGGDRFLSLHAVRRDTDRPGIYAKIVDFSQRKWNVVEEAILWESPVPVIRDPKMASIFSFLKFGQPGAILLSDGDVLMTHWFSFDGQYKTVATRISMKG